MYIWSAALRAYFAALARRISRSCPPALSPPTTVTLDFYVAAERSEAKRRNLALLLSIVVEVVYSDSALARLCGHIAAEGRAPEKQKQMKKSI